MEVKYMTETNLDPDEYKKYVKTMQGSQTGNNVIAILACVWLLAAGIYNIAAGGRTVLGAFMIAVGIIAPLAVRYGAARQTERDFERIRQAGGDHFRVRFYDDHLETQNDTSHGSYEYDKMFNIVENDTCFYLELEKGQSVIIQKKNCSDDLIGFIRTLKK